jgi:hypothetical protein
MTPSSPLDDSLLAVDQKKEGRLEWKAAFE